MRGRDCRVDIRLCVSSFNQESADAFSSFFECPAHYVKDSVANSSLDRYKVESPSEVWTSGGIVITGDDSMFGKDHNTLWTDGKLIVCQIGGEYSVDKLDVTQEQ